MAAIDAVGNIDIAPAGARRLRLLSAITAIPRATLATARLFGLIVLASAFVSLAALTAVGGAYYMLFSLAH